MAVSPRSFKGRRWYYQVVILDEANIATHFNLLSVEELIDLIRMKPKEVELVITGRKADPQIIEMADLVTEMKEIKHYYHKGVIAREGIEKWMLYIIMTIIPYMLLILPRLTGGLRRYIM